MSVAADSTIAPIFCAAWPRSLRPARSPYPATGPRCWPMIGLVPRSRSACSGRAGSASACCGLIPVTMGFCAALRPSLRRAARAAGALPTRARGHLPRASWTSSAWLETPIPGRSGWAAACWQCTRSASPHQPAHPGALIGLVAAGIAVASFHLEARGVSLLGALSVPLPHLSSPGPPDWEAFSRMLQLALVVAVVCMANTAAVASTFPSGMMQALHNVSRDFGAGGRGQHPRGPESPRSPSTPVAQHRDRARVRRAIEPHC